MELYGIVGNVQRKTTNKGRELLEVAFYSLDIETLAGKNQIIQVAFWDELDKYEKLITKGARLRIFVDKLKPNPQMDKNGNPVVYFNANGQAFVYVNTGNSSNSNNNDNNQGQARNTSNQNSANTNGQNQNTYTNQNQNSNTNNNAPKQNTYTNQGGNQPNQNNYNNQQSNNQKNNQTQKTNNNPVQDQMSDIEDFLGSL